MTDPIVPAAQPNESATTLDINDPLQQEIHRKLLSEKKRVQEERDNLLKFKEERDLLVKEKVEREEALAKKRGDFETLLKSRDEELARIREEKNELSERIANGRKMNAVLEALGSPVDPKWYELIDVSKVVINPETFEVDAMTVAQVTDSLKRKWPEMVSTRKVLPANAPQGNSAGTISHEEWKKLPLAEMKKWKQSQII